MPQQPLFPTIEDAYYAEIAIHHGWHTAAHRALTKLAKTGKPFTADHLRRLIGEDVQPHHPNVIGAFFRVARTEGIIRPTGRFVDAETPSRRGGAIREWVGTDAMQNAGLDAA